MVFILSTNKNPSEIQEKINGMEKNRENIQANKGSKLKEAKSTKA